ncbi:MAG: 3-deoxy-D-manno-octulosonic acid transferase [Paracoccaceae bacterium]
MLNRLDEQGVTGERQRERLGYATQPRPNGTLIWFHGASVGESLSALTLITHLGERLPDAQFLVTSGTATSAQIVAKRLPPRTRHQFAALDAPGPVRRFLSHWRPQAALFVESELWPLTLNASRKSGAKLALVNARLSAGSLRNWHRAPKTARFILDQFCVFLTQNDEMASNLKDIGADPVRVHPGTNLKAFGPALPYDETVLKELRDQITDRPVWIASSTHDGEEETILKAHKAVLQDYPDALLVLAPRHPERAGTVQNLISDAGLTSARRSEKAKFTTKTQVYLADTLGELGLWYALSPMVFLAGSLLPIGGHNPFEPARSGCAILTGPGTHNFSETYAPLIAHGGAFVTPDAPAIAWAISDWISHPGHLSTARLACETFVTRQDNTLAHTLDTLESALNLR